MPLGGRSSRSVLKTGGASQPISREMMAPTIRIASTSFRRSAAGPSPARINSAKIALDDDEPMVAGKVRTVFVMEDPVSG